MDHQRRIDELLERHLGLLDEYTRLQQRLSKLFAGMFQDLARANFSAERGMRYGRDHYDQRMKASRRLSVEVRDMDVPVFAISYTGSGDEAGDEAESKAAADDENGGEHKQGKAEPRQSNDPLRWFGLFASGPLRVVQQQSIESVESVIPRLASVNAEMLATEIDIRRARKRRTRAAATERKADKVAIRTAHADSKAHPAVAGAD